MIAKLFYFFNRIVVKYRKVLWFPPQGIEPKLVPNHYSIFIARRIKSVVRGHAHPIADDIEIHFPVKTNIGVVILGAAAQEIFGHSPTAALRVNTYPIDVKVERVVVGIIRIFPNSKDDRLLVGNS